MTQEELLRLGMEAEHVLNNGAFTTAMDLLDRKLVEAWAEGAFTTMEQREEAFARVRGARMFRETLLSMINDMKIEKANAERRGKRAELRGDA